MKKITMSLMLILVFSGLALCRGFSGGHSVSVGRGYTSFSRGYSAPSFRSTSSPSISHSYAPTRTVNVYHDNSSPFPLWYWFMLKNQNSSHQNGSTITYGNQPNWNHILITVVIVGLSLALLITIMARL